MRGVARQGLSGSCRRLSSTSKKCFSFVLACGTGDPLGATRAGCAPHTKQIMARLPLLALAWQPTRVAMFTRVTVFTRATVLEVRELARAHWVQQ